MIAHEKDNAEQYSVLFLYANFDEPASFNIARLAGDKLFPFIFVQLSSHFS